MATHWIDRYFVTLLLLLRALTILAVQTCNAGYSSLDGAACSACAEGTYKSNIGTEACAVCPANTYTDQTGSTSASTCLCNAGYTGLDGGPCNACLVGKYKDNVGSEACLPCKDHTLLANKHVTRFRVVSEQDAAALTGSICDLLPSKINLQCCTDRVSLQADLTFSSAASTHA